MSDFTELFMPLWLMTGRAYICRNEWEEEGFKCHVSERHVSLLSPKMEQ